MAGLEAHVKSASERKQEQRRKETKYQALGKPLEVHAFSEHQSLGNYDTPFRPEFGMAMRTATYTDPATCVADPDTLNALVATNDAGAAARELEKCGAISVELWPTEGSVTTGDLKTDFNIIFAHTGRTTRRSADSQNRAAHDEESDETRRYVVPGGRVHSIEATEPLSIAELRRLFVSDSQDRRPEDGGTMIRDKPRGECLIPIEALNAVEVRAATGHRGGQHSGAAGLDEIGPEAQSPLVPRSLTTVGDSATPFLSTSAGQCFCLALVHGSAIVLSPRGTWERTQKEYEDRGWYAKTWDKKPLHIEMQAGDTLFFAPGVPYSFTTFGDALFDYCPFYTAPQFHRSIRRIRRMIEYAPEQVKEYQWDDLTAVVKRLDDESVFSCAERTAIYYEINDLLNSRLVAARQAPEGGRGSKLDSFLEECEKWRNRMRIKRMAEMGIGPGSLAKGGASDS